MAKSELSAEDVVLIAHVIRDRIERRQWRSETEREVGALARSRGTDRETVSRLGGEVRRQYDEAGAGFAGRF